MGFRRTAALVTAIAMLVAFPSGGSDAPTSPALLQQPGTRFEGVHSARPDQTVAGSISDPAVRQLLSRVLERNPRLAQARAEAAAAAQQAPQTAALPDPMAGLTLYLQSPETRVGPQLAVASLSQRFPWFGTLRLREQAAVLEAAAAVARVDAIRLELVTEARSLAYELAFLDLEAAIVREDRETLEHFEELARARYATGVGLGQAVVKIQAEITRDSTRLLDIAQQRGGLQAALSALSDRPDDLATPDFQVPHFPSIELQLAELRQAAVQARPETAAARARIEAAAARVELARKLYRPDITAGLGYTVVGRRDDRAGELNPPEDNGRDIVGLSASVNLPVWRQKLAAGVEEAAQRKLAEEEGLRATITAINREIEDLARRIPLLQEELELYDRVLTTQAEEAVDSAVAGYSSGTHNALDLLDADRVLLQVRIAAARVRTDHSIAIARLEGAVAQPLAANGGTS